MEMVEVIKRLAERVQTQWGVTLAARIGVHTGLVVAGEMGAEDRRVMDIVGEAPNIAARLQEGADANTVVLSAATYRLTLDAFTFRALGGRSRELPYRRCRLPLARKVVSVVGRVDYVRVQVRDGQVEPLAISGASILSSTTRADGFVLVPGESEGQAAGEQVEVFLYDDQGLPP